jgi:N-acyl-D-aspartate/D-glutamate deacylase
MLDIAIRGGVVIDGSGSPRRFGDVGIHGGRVAAIGEVEDAAEEIDASGLVVAPGFIDIHTHFDAQVFWDPALTPSSLHGVTTAVAGNCGFTLAPWDESSADYLVRMLSVVEGMPLEALQAGVPGGWTSTAGYLDQVDGTTAINIGFMVGHSAIRRLVMGVDATERQATPREVAAMKVLLADGLGAGGLGLSSSWGIAHLDGGGRPVPSRWADRHELVALAEVCRGFEGTSIEFIPGLTAVFDESELDLLSDMSVAGGRPLNWNVLRITAGNSSTVEGMLAAGSHARGRGGRVVALVMPLPSRARFSFGTGFVLDLIPDWSFLFSLPPDERLRVLGEPAVRRRLAAGAVRAAGPMSDMADWGPKVVTEVADPALERWQGRTLADIGREQGKEPFEALLDLVCADKLRTTFSRPYAELSEADWKANVEAWRDGRAVIGGSDAGAHLDFTANFDYQVYLLEEGVRAHQALPLEEAVHYLTDVPAQLYGLRDRGRLVEGAQADVVIFDESTVARGALATRHDLPAGAGRLYAEPVGVAHVLVNGGHVVTDGRLTEGSEGPPRCGRLLRSGRDTHTPSLI